MVATAERYLIITHVKNKESNKQPFRICLAVQLTDGRILIKKEDISSHLVYNIVILGKMGEKTTFFKKISWIWTCSQIFRKFSYGENLLLFPMLHEASALL